jgi:hypothetical protein
VDISDHVYSKSVHSFQIRFTLHPAIEIAEIEDSMVSLRQKGGNETLLTVDTKLAGDAIDSGGGWQVEDADVSPRYGALEATARIVFTFRGRGAINARTSIVPAISAE